jgi:hypothetical protein
MSMVPTNRGNRATAIAQRQPQDLDVLSNLPKAPLDKLDSLNELFLTLRDKVNFLCPLASVDNILPMHQVSLRAVYINPEVNAKGVGPECYRGKAFCDEDEVALGKVALDKLEAAAGVRRIGGGRTDDRTEPHFCEFNVILEITDFDGTKRTGVGTRALDLRDGGPDATKTDYVGGQTKLVPLSVANLLAKRQHMLALCETKARLRALRELLGLQQKYSLEDLSKPFVIPKLVPHLDPNDPETKSALIATALGQTPQLYGKPTEILGSGQLPPEQMPPIKQVEGTTVNDPDETGNDDTKSVAQASAPTSAPAPSAAETDDDLGNFKPPIGAPEAVCACPCGHQKEITKEREAATINHVGSARCPECFPGRYFNLELHKDLTTLELKGYPGGLTPKEAAKMAKADAARVSK